MNGVSRRALLQSLAAGGLAGAFGALGAASGPAAAAANGGAAKLTGRIVLPDSAGYDAARLLWDRLFVSYPLAIVYCETAEDVANAVAWSRQNGVQFRVRAGGHALEGWSSLDGGVVIDVSGLKQISIDPSAGTATVGAGFTLGEIVAALGEAGFAIPTGSEASVGMAGLALGGGIGLLSRSMGVLCDHILAVDIVVPDGGDGARPIRADGDNHSDLLWACRGGGGGNFGVATSFTFRLHPMPQAAYFKVVWDWSDPAAAFAAWQRWAPTVDERLGTTFVFLPRSGNAIEAEGVFIGSEDEAKRLLEPLLAVGAPTLSMATRTWAQHFADINKGPRQLDYWRFTSSWAYEPLPPEAIAVVVEFLSDAPAPACNYWCLNWGGATRSEPAGGAAFYHRQPLYYAEPGAGWNDDAQTGPVAIWLARFRQAMRPFVRGAYVNVPDAALADWGELYYGSNFQRLREIKRVYDPTEVFRFPQSIPPA